MIENIVKRKPGTFSYGIVTNVETTTGRVQVAFGSNIHIWIPTSLDLGVGDTVIVARNDQDASRLIVQHSQRSLPSRGTLLLI